MIVKLVVYSLVALVSAAIVPGVHVKGFPTAVGLVVLFAVLNVLLGWLLWAILGLLTLPVTILTLGLFAFFLPALINAVLLRLTAGLMSNFTIEGWGAAFLMGLLFAFGHFVSQRLLD